MSGSVAITVLVVGAVLAIAVLSYRRRAKRRRAARELAVQLVPEIRAILADSEARASDTACYTSRRSQLPRILPPETLFAVETFYQSVEALARASAAMAAAFAEGGETSLGDRIRAKDMRDRLMKDVFYSGEAAIQKLESAS